MRAIVSSQICDGDVLANANTGNIFKDKYLSHVRGEVMRLIQEIGSSQNILLQQSETLKDDALSHGTRKDNETLTILHRRVDSLLDDVVAKLRKIAGY
jgi:hypothetical protein